MEKKRTPYLQYILTAAVLLGLVVAAARYLNGEEVLHAFRTFNYAFAPVMLILSTAYLVLKSWRFVFMIRPVSDVRAGIAFRAYMAGQAATLLPGGVAARSGLMNQVGVSVARSGPAVAFSSILDQAVFIACSLIAALWFEPARVPALILLAILLVVAFALAVPVTRRWLVRAGDWASARLKVSEQWQHFLEALPVVATPRIMAITLAITLVAFAVNIVLLDLSIRGVGVSLPYPTLFLVYILPTMFGRIFPVPGGIGVTEASMVGFLAATSPQIGLETAAAAVAIFRIVAVLYSVFLGALVYFFAWRGEKEVAAPATRSTSSATSSSS